MFQGTITEFDIIGTQLCTTLLTVSLDPVEIGFFEFFLHRLPARAKYKIK